VIIVATTGQARAEAKVNVVVNPGRAARDHRARARGRTGDVIRLHITAEDKRALPVNGAPVRWSVSGNGASIDPDGGFVADQPGTYLVTASSGEVAGNYSIKVTKRVQTRKLEQVSFVGFGDIRPRNRGRSATSPMSPPLRTGSIPSTSRPGQSAQGGLARGRCAHRQRHLHDARRPDRGADSRGSLVAQEWPGLSST
jgi:hypothetical protein